MILLDFEKYPELLTGQVLFEQQPEWLSLLGDNCLPGQRLLVGVDSAADPGAILPLRMRTKSYFGSRIRWLEGLTALYSSHYQPVFRDAEGLRALLQDVLAAGACDVLGFSAADEDGDLHQALLTVCVKLGWPIVCKPDFEHWYLNPVPPSFADYCAGLPGPLRSTLKRKQSSAERQFKLRFDVCSDATSLPVALDAYRSVYQRSWKTAEQHPGFIGALCELAVARGWLRLGVLYLDDTPAAAQIWMTIDGRASIFKLAYDEQFSKWSVGSLLTAHMMRWAMECDQVREIEYGKGGEAYKRDWMSHRRQRVQIECFNPSTFAGRLMQIRHKTLPTLRDRLLNRLD